MTAGNIVSEKDGIPVLYDICTRGFGVRVVHPQNPKAPSKNLSVTLVYLSPGGYMAPHDHPNEEVYFILQGEGEGYFGLDKPVNVQKGMFVHLPPGAEHGLKNTGDEVLIAMLATSPASPTSEEWKIRE
jgi:quercetin dioxygenase-like cupin family protein